MFCAIKITNLFQIRFEETRLTISETVPSLWLFVIGNLKRPILVEMSKDKPHHSPFSSIHPDFYLFALFDLYK